MFKTEFIKYALSFLISLHLFIWLWMLVNSPEPHTEQNLGSCIAQLSLRWEGRIRCMTRHKRGQTGRIPCVWRGLPDGGQDQIAWLSWLSCVVRNQISDLMTSKICQNRSKSFVYFSDAKHVWCREWLNCRSLSASFCDRKLGWLGQAAVVKPISINFTRRVYINRGLKTGRSRNLAIWFKTLKRRSWQSQENSNGSDRGNSHASPKQESNMKKGAVRNRRYTAVKGRYVQDCTSITTEKVQGKKQTGIQGNERKWKISN